MEQTMSNRFDRTEFIITKSFIEAFSLEEVQATWDDMVALNIAKAPYPSFDIVGTTNLFINVVLEGMDSHLQDRANADLEKWRGKLVFTDYTFTGMFIETENRRGWKDITHILDGKGRDNPV